MALPQGLIDALNLTLDAKDSADKAKGVAEASAAAVIATQAQADADAATAVARAADLAAKYGQLRALEDAYFKPGAAPPTPPTP